MVNLAWRIPGMGHPSGLLSMGSHRVGHDWMTSLSLSLYITYRVGREGFSDAVAIGQIPEGHKGQSMRLSGEAVFRTERTTKSLQSCPTLCDPIDSSPLGSPIPGILQARTLEWVAISFSNAWKWKLKGKSLSCVWPCSLPGSSIHGIFQARVLERGAIAFSEKFLWGRQNVTIQMAFKRIPANF